MCAAEQMPQRLRQILPHSPPVPLSCVRFQRFAWAVTRPSTPLAHVPFSLCMRLYDQRLLQRSFLPPPCAAPRVRFACRHTLHLMQAARRRTSHASTLPAVRARSRIAAISAPRIRHDRCSHSIPLSPCLRCQAKHAAPTLPDAAPSRPPSLPPLYWRGGGGLPRHPPRLSHRSAPPHIPGSSTATHTHNTACKRCRGHAPSLTPTPPPPCLTPQRAASQTVATQDEPTHSHTSHHPHHPTAGTHSSTSHVAR
jgi:hypothetical protein